jgi:ArsR family transcriptional regulator
MENLNKENAKIFKALADEQRLIILELLQSGEKCACEILDNLNIGQSSLSYHMKILVNSRIVESRNNGKWTFYQISNKGSTDAINIFKELTTTKNIDNSNCKKYNCENKNSI